MNVLHNSNSQSTKILFHALPNCKAKSVLQLDSINTNNSNSVEQNSKALAQNKFNTRQPIQNLTGPLPTPCAQILFSLKTTLFRLILFRSFSPRTSEHIYIYVYIYIHIIYQIKYKHCRI